jgi:ring-1,2-phenylacetyl-CoA epoxidase subunit PaaC
MLDKLYYTLQLADNAVIIGQRLGEWCGHGPVLEQDIAMTNMSLDHIGRARSLYQYAAQQYNALDAEQKSAAFSSIALENKAAKGKGVDEDDLAFLRDAWDFRNILLVEQPNNDWAYTLARSFYYDIYNYFLFTAMQNSPDVAMAAIAAKSLKEVTYHMRWSSEWIIRMGDGTEESHERVQKAIEDLWPFTGEPFTMNDHELAMKNEHIAPDGAMLKEQWITRVMEVLQEATLSLPANNWMQEGGKEGRHTEHLGYILADMQFMQRTYPNMEW